MAPIFDEVIFWPVATALPEHSLFCLANACRLSSQQLASAAAEQVWTSRLAFDFGRNAVQMLEISKMSYATARAAHRALARLRQRLKETIVIIEGDLCQIPLTHHVDVVVCPSVPNCGPYGPCARSVHHAAGPGLWDFVQALVLPRFGGSLDVGQAILVPSFEFPRVRAIVQVVGPTFDMANRKELLRDAYCSVLHEVASAPGEPLRHVALASISTGGNGIAPIEAAPIAMVALRNAVCSGSFQRIYVVAWDAYTRSVFEDVKQTMLQCLSEDPEIPEVQDTGWD